MVRINPVKRSGCGDSMLLFFNPEQDRNNKWLFSGENQKSDKIGPTFLEPVSD